MYDYTDISVFCPKGKPNLSQLKAKGTLNGWQYYELAGVKPLQIGYREDLRELRIRGSLPYFWQGHNFAFAGHDLRDSLDYVSTTLEQNIYSGIAEAFEFGTVAEVNSPVSSILSNHISLKGFRTNDYRDNKGRIITRNFESLQLRVKLYDVSANFSGKLDRDVKRALQEAYCFDSAKHYLKLENHYKRPTAYFKERIRVSDLFHPDVQAMLRDDLTACYLQIKKTTSYMMPASKKDLTTPMLILLALKNLEGAYGISAEELVLEQVKAFPDLLTAEDRKARIRQIRALLKRTEAAQVDSPYDISETLQKGFARTDHYSVSRSVV